MKEVDILVGACQEEQVVVAELAAVATDALRHILTKVPFTGPLGRGYYIETDNSTGSEVRTLVYKQHFRGTCWRNEIIGSTSTTKPSELRIGDRNAILRFTRDLSSGLLSQMTLESQRRACEIRSAIDSVRSFLRPVDRHYS